MSELTREEIEEYRSPTRPVPPGRADAICDMALRTLDAEAREDECTHELHRLARELGLPDEGPQENVDGALARIRELETVLRQERDIRSHRGIYLQLIAEKIGLEPEPHQTYWERMLERIETLATTPPPDSEPAEGWVDERGNWRRHGRQPWEHGDTPPQRRDALEAPTRKFYEAHQRLREERDRCRDKCYAVLRLPDAWRADAMGYDKYDDSQNIFAAAINYCADALDRALAQPEQGRVRAPTSEELHEKRREQRDKHRPRQGWKLVPELVDLPISIESFRVICHQKSYTGDFDEMADRLCDLANRNLTQSEQGRVPEESVIDDIVDGYELWGEDEHGNEGRYTPSEHDRIMLKDFAVFLLSELDARAAAPQPQEGESDGS